MKINLLGSGYMGKQICSLFVALGFDVILWRNSSEKLDDDSELPGFGIMAAGASLLFVSRRFRK